METKDIMMAIANIHNNLCKMLVSGDNTIILGDSLKSLRALLSALNQESCGLNGKETEEDVK